MATIQHDTGWALPDLDWGPGEKVALRSILHFMQSDFNKLKEVIGCDSWKYLKGNRLKMWVKFWFCRITIRRY